MKAIWNGAELAQSNETILVEGNHYFPPDSLCKALFQPSAHSSYCPWKGTASYYHIVVDGKTNENAAWYYPETKPKAEHIRNYVAFWNGVEIVES
ncbi:MAG: DUF427 domain-containing protein [Panacagrimonas sp.]